MIILNVSACVNHNVVGVATVSQQMPVSASQPELNYTTGVQPATSIASASTMSAWVHHMTPPGNFGLKKGSGLLFFCLNFVFIGHAHF